ncbi:MULTISPECIES: divalent metal cation transporter [unclassified Pseudomonas]|uniref:divalent metal cation transporter n=1 Tax=unclassified Pseudomonas TaxID=196821 RepID=UPI002114F6E2|nr:MULTISPECIES: divalent metal cation transporter [unclassified Pseudomonas]
MAAAPDARPLIDAPDQARSSFSRIQADTIVGMGFSNIIAFFIMLTTAVTLNMHGVTDIQSSSQAASALRPIAGEFAFWLFSGGIIGTGMLAVPVLAGSAAYAVSGTTGCDRYVLGLHCDVEHLLRGTASVDPGDHHVRQTRPAMHRHPVTPAVSLFSVAHRRSWY